MSEYKPTEYEMATLATRVAPELCRDSGTMVQALELSWKLLRFAHGLLETRELNTQKRVEEYIAGQKFESLVPMGPLNKFEKIPINRAIWIITGHEKTRRTGEAVEAFETLLKTVPADRTGIRDMRAWLKAHNEEGFFGLEVLFWRGLAEEYGICKKKLLTVDLLLEAKASLRQSVQPATDPLKTATGSRKTATPRSKSAKK